MMDIWGPWVDHSSVLRAARITQDSHCGIIRTIVWTTTYMWEKLRGEDMWRLVKPEAYVFVFSK